MANEKRLDLINRSAILDDISRIGVVSVGTVLGCLSNAPTVDAVEVVHGYWELSIFNHPMSFFVDHTCSVCGHMERLDICASPLKWNYCPNCGAKMDGDGNGAV